MPIEQKIIDNVVPKSSENHWEWLSTSEAILKDMKELTTSKS